ncbi:MAG: hypothetical protein GY751_26195 [Bacteroidetes bacterium]|jgi:hypothetical protein|nr:hypothetical protein [Bacteroidota bacterium]
MTFGHDFFGNSNRVMNAQTMLGPGGEEQPTQTTLVATQTSQESEPEVIEESPNPRALLLPIAGMFALSLIITLAGFNTRGR